MINASKKIEETLKKLVSFRSVTGDKVAVQNILSHIESLFTGLPVYITWFLKDTTHPALYISTKKGLNVDLLVLGHADVVPGPEEMFNLVKKGDILYGRGVCDMKGPDAVIIEAFKEVLNNKSNKESIALLFTTDEETGGKSAELLAKKLKPKKVFVPDGGESEYRISNSTRGILQIVIRAQGLGGGVSGINAENNNAVENLMKKYFKWKAYEKLKKNPLDTQVTRISGGVGGNMLPKEGEIFLDIRFRKESSKDILKRLNKYFISTKELKIHLTTVISAEPSFLSPSHPFLKKYKKIAEKVLNKEVEILGQNGSHDGRFFASVGVPVFATRIRSGGMHSDKEWASLDALNNLYNIVVNFLQS